MKKQAVIIVFGQVQGVFFRIFVKDTADELGLVGLVKNAADGTVKVLAEGEEEKLKKLISYCKEGPKFAKVDKVEIKWQEAAGQFSNFAIK